MTLKELSIKLGLSVDEASFAKGQLAARALETALTKIVQVAADTARAFVDNIHAVTEYGGKIYELAQVTGIGQQSLQRLAKAASLEGVSIEDFGHSIVLLSRQMSAAKDGTEESAKAFHKAGVSYSDSAGKLRPAEDVFIDIADRFHNMEDGAEKTALALKLFGRSGAAMIPVLNQGKEEIEEFMKAQVMDPEQIKAAHEIEVIQRRLLGVTKALWREAIGPLLPALRDLYQRYLDWRKANAEIMKQRIREFVGSLVKAVNAVGDVFDLVIGTIKAFTSVISEAAGGIKWLVSQFAVMKWYLGTAGLIGAIIAFQSVAVNAGLAIMGSWIKAAAPFLAIGAAIGALMLIIDDFQVYSKGGKSLIGAFMNRLDDWTKPRKDDPWFVVALKDFLRYLRETIEVLAHLDEVFGDGSKARAMQDAMAGKNKGQIRMEADSQTIETARRRVGLGLPLTKAESGALQRAGVPEAEFVKKYSATTAVAPLPAPTAQPEARLPAWLPFGGGAAPRADGPVVGQISIGPITQLPGESGEGFAQRVNEILQGHIEDAVAAGR